MAKIVKLTTYDLRFPTSDHLDGSDAMNPDPDYSAAYVIIESDQSSLNGHSFAFTLVEEMIYVVTQLKLFNI